MKHLLISLIILATGTLVAQSTQDRIDNAMGNCFAARSIEPLIENFATLESDYWKAYNLYLQSAYNIKTGKNIENQVEKGVNILETIESKNSEECALLAALISMQMSYLTKRKDRIKASKTISKLIDKAKMLDPYNPRAYYIAGINDYHTPAKYGGGLKAEKLLSKALELYDSDEGNITWGKVYAQEIFDQIQDKT